MSTLRAEAVRTALQCEDWRCQCHTKNGNVHCPTPTHADSNPSCKISESNDKLLVHCFVCNQEDVWEAVENLMGIERVETKEEPTETGQTYWYTDKEYNKLFCVERYYDSGGRKRFRQSHLCNGEITPGMGGDCGCGDVPRVLYNLPVVAMPETQEVFWVEGEKDVATLNRHGAVATCTPQGSAAFGKCLVSNPNLLEVMSGKDVYVIADNDMAGKKYAREVTERLMHYANQVWSVSFGDAYEQGYDISDYLAKDNDFRKWVDANKIKVYDSEESGKSIDVLPPYSIDSVGDLTMAIAREGAREHIEVVASDVLSDKGDLIGKVSVAMVTTATGRKSTILPKTSIIFNKTSSQDAVVKALSKRKNYIDWVEVIDKLTIAVNNSIQSYGKVVDVKDVDTTKTDRDWLLKPIIGHNEYVAIYAQGGVGKSLFAGACALSLATGMTLIPGVVPKSKGVPTLYLDWEDEDIVYAGRLQKMLGPTLEEIPENRLKYMAMRYNLADSIDGVRREIDKHGIEMVIIDSVGAASGGDLNNSTIATRFTNMVRGLGCAVMAITHISKMSIWVGNKDENDIMPIGSVFFVNGPRASFFLAGDHNAESDSKEHVLVQTKSNSGAIGNPLGYKAWFDNDNNMIGFDEHTPFENPKLRAYCKKADVIEYYLKGVDKTIDDLVADIPEYKPKEIEYQLNYFKGKKFEQLEGGYWRSNNQEDAYDW